MSSLRRRSKSNPTRLNKNSKSKSRKNSKKTNTTTTTATKNRRKSRKKSNIVRDPDDGADAAPDDVRGAVLDLPGQVNVAASGSAAGGDAVVDPPSRFVTPSPVPQDGGDEGEDDDASSRIRVAVRVRPRIGRELEAGEAVITRVEAGGTQISMDPPAGSDFKGQRTTFTFDRVFDMEASQEQVFTEYGSRAVAKAIKGYNGCIFAYGQTGSGKTYTMTGTRDQPGIIYRCAEAIHAYMAEMMGGGEHEVTLTVSFLEIYNEKLKDLLLASDAKAQRLAIRQSKSDGVYVQNASHREISTLDELESVIDEGNGRRTVAHTNMNEESSRSHSVLTLSIVQHRLDDPEDLSRLESRLHLVDLAGSERQSRTGARGARLKEGAAINQSLSALGNVINALVEGRKHIPYRDSKLTRLLSDSLGGNSITLVIANMSCASESFNESMSTLRFADRAKQIKNKPVVNMDPKVRRIKELQKEVARLKQMLVTCAHCNKGPMACPHCGTEVALDAELAELSAPPPGTTGCSKCVIM